MRKVRLTHQNLVDFQSIATDCLDVLYPMSYLESSAAFVLVEDDEQEPYHPSSWLGGFVVKDRPPFRALQGLPDPSLMSSLSEVCSLSQLAEVNALWVRPDRRNGQTAVVILIMVADTVRNAGKSFAVYCYSNDQVLLSRIYARALPIRIYSGPTLQLEGMSVKPIETVEVLHASDLSDRIKQRYPRCVATRRHARRPAGRAASGERN
jgi:hypothetical protein